MYTMKRLFKPIVKGGKRDRLRARKQLYGALLLIVGITLLVAGAYYVGGR